jgi:arylsulfatase A-like enzyme
MIFKETLICYNGGMNGKRKLHYTIMHAIAIIGLLASLFYCTGKGNDIGFSKNPNLMANPLSFQYHKGAKESLQTHLSDPQIGKHFKQSAINTLYSHKPNPWLGRICDNDVSYHALFAIDDCSIAYKTSQFDAGALIFSIYHPKDSKLTYKIWLKQKKSKKLLFSKVIKEKSFSDEEVKLQLPQVGDFEVMLETVGKGLGAWVNPRFQMTKKKPRVFIVMVVDTLRWDHTSVYGYHRATTPRMKQLAADGVTYEHAFSSTSWTLPSHVSLFSGKDLSQHGVVSPSDSISTDYPLLAELFQRAGFVTTAFTGGGFVEDSYGFYRGFQYYSNAPGNVFSMNSAERVLNHFKNYIKRFQGNDLFVFLHTYQVHAPYKAPRKYIEAIAPDLQRNLLGVAKHIKQKHEYFKPIAESERQTLIDLYDASILYTDDVLLGGVVSFLKEKDLYDDAMIAVLSDHGEEFYDHGSWEHGHTLYNELIKIPLVVKFPFNESSKKRRNYIEKSLTSITDIAGLMLKESGFQYEIDSFPIEIGKPQRRLPILFPASPIIKQFLTKISFVDEKFHFIFNRKNEQKLAFFDPQPKKVPVYELFKREDLKEERNVYKQYFQHVNQLKKPLKFYIEKLKLLNRKGRKLDKDLEDKLKSLGYLGN